LEVHYAPVQKKPYTYADCLEWDESERYGIIDGEACMMATSNRIHQEISGALFAAIYNVSSTGTKRIRHPAPAQSVSLRGAKRRSNPDGHLLHWIASLRSQ
jgi:hypothetical protein